MQSLLTWHCCATAHPKQTAPPQSTSVSSPLAFLSVQAGDWQRLVAHTPLLQSLPDKQCWGGTQVLQTPPQSRSVSLPLRTPSAHPGSWQDRLVQTFSLQSVLTVQA